MEPKKKIVIAGGTGFVGRYLTRRFLREGFEVAVLARHPAALPAGAQMVVWNGRDPGPWASVLEGADLLVNLSGASVNCRHSASNKRKLTESRLQAVNALGAALIAAERPPKTWINASGAGIYNPDTPGAHGEESTDYGDDFIAALARSWEAALFECPVHGIRRVALRMGVVLGKGGGAWPVLLRAATFGAGGRSGSGKQFVSWIHEEDVYSAILFLYGHPGIEGPVNLVSPSPETNRTFMSAVRKQAGMPLGIPQPAWLVRIGTTLMGTDPSLLLRNSRVVPERLLAAGFRFTHPTLADALARLTGTAGASEPGGH